MFLSFKENVEAIKTGDIVKHSRCFKQPLMITNISWEGKYFFVHDADVGHAKVEEQQQQQNLPDDSTVESTTGSGLGKSLMNEDDLKASYAVDTPVG